MPKIMQPWKLVCANLQVELPGRRGRRRRESGSHARAEKRLKSFARTHSRSEFLAVKHENRILVHSSDPVCGFSMMRQVL